MKQFLSFIGKFLMVLAFAATAAEVVAHARGADLGWIPSSAELWSFYAPARAAAFASAHPSGVLHLLLMLPPWALFGLSGFALVMIFHDKSAGVDPELEDSLFLYDELMKQVKDGGYDDFSDNDEDTFEPRLNEDIIPADDSYADPQLKIDEGPKRDYLLGNKS